MTWVDYIIILIIVVSALISLLRGFLREIVSLITWVVGFWVALRFAHQLGAAFSVIRNPSVRLMVAFVVLFVLILIVGALINVILGKVVKKIGAASSDRVLGLLFGLLRGVVVVAVLVILARFTSFPEQPAWRQARLVPYAQGVTGWMRRVLPERVSEEMMHGLHAAADPRRAQ
ncbi:MAG: CvpA family protein [Gammaproteobacteria bacterium]